MLNISTVSMFKKDRLKKVMVIWHESFLTAVIISDHYVCEIQLNHEIDNYPVILYYRKIAYAGESTLDLLAIWQATIINRLYSEDLGDNVLELHSHHMHTIPKEDLDDIRLNWYEMLLDQFRQYALTTKVILRMRSDVFVIIEDGVALFVVNTNNTVMLFHNMSDIERSPMRNYRSALGAIICDGSVQVDKALSIKREHKKLAKEILKEFSSRYTVCNTTNSVFDDIQL